MASTLVTPLQMGNALLAAGFTRVQLPVMIAIGLAESGGDPEAKHVNRDGSIDYGAWQINSVHGFDPAELLTLTGNARAAKRVYDAQGYGAWTVFKTGAYRSKLGQVGSAAQDATPGGGGDPASGGVHRESVFTSLGQAFGFLTALGNPDFWRRVGIVTLGALLIVFAMLWYLRKPAAEAVKVAEGIKP